LCAEVSNASAGNDTLLDGRTGRMQGIFHASLLLLHFSLRRGADIDDGNTAGETGQMTFLNECAWPNVPAIFHDRFTLIAICSVSS
jgi:hypothetical protein